MRIEVFEGERLIGHSEVVAADPPMGVASGAFEPTTDYDRDAHANTVDGDYVGDRGHSLTAKVPNSGVLDGQIWIEDYQESLEERHAYVRIGYPEYERFFGNDTAYRSYYRLDLSEEERAAEDKAIRAELQARNLRAWLWFVGLIIAAVLLMIWIF